MAERAPSNVSIGRIIFRSWEHRWQTGEEDATSISVAKRLLPEALTQPIYEILYRWESELWKSSLPYRPFGLRIRPSADNWLDSMSGEDCFSEMVWRSQSLREICPGWDTALPVPRTKSGKYGMVFAPEGDRIIREAYSFEWREVNYPPEVNVDQLLGVFSPRYEEPPMFPVAL